MVAGAGHDIGGKDRRRTLAARPTEGRGNSKGLRGSTHFLAGPSVRKFWSVCASQLDIRGQLDALRAGRSRRSWNDPGIGTGLWAPRPRLTTGDAPGSEDAGGPTTQPNFKRIRSKRLTSLLSDKSSIRRPVLPGLAASYPLGPQFLEAGYTTRRGRDPRHVASGCLRRQNRL